AALPLHCAGEYKQGGQVLSKLFVSSYTPSLSALIKAHTRHAKMTQEITFAAIGQATPDTSDTSFKFAPLHYIDQELGDIEGLLPIPSVMFTKVMGADATRDQALQMLVNNQWLHISCHGRQVPQEPFKSCLAMADGLVSLLDIINADISTHEFAFLSACETAMGDLSTPYEVIHLAAGLQFMGVKSVIGTLWAVDDEVAYKLVLAFYKELCKDGTLDCTMAAGALHKAVATLAKDGVPVQERAMFVHIGI
ncbi:CHAT domain-containing protein, partial [Melanogaster broomeanus]